MVNKSKYDRPKKYTFFNSGNSYDFNPDKYVSYDGKLISAYDLHVSEVKFRNTADCFILTDEGKIVKI